MTDHCPLCGQPTEPTPALAEGNLRRQIRCLHNRFEQGCLNCVAGTAVEIYQEKPDHFRLVYQDKSHGFVRLRDRKFEWVTGHVTDAATATGMYDHD